MKEFPEKLKKALKAKKMTKGALCNEIGMTLDGFKAMEDNETIKVKTLEKICEVLDVDISYFLDIEIEPTKSEGYLRRFIDDVVKESNEWRMKYYQLYEQTLNFNLVSKSATCWQKYFFFVPLPNNFTNIKAC